MAATPLKPATKLKTALLLVDIQQGLTVESGYFGTERSTPQFEENIATLLAGTREHNASQREDSKKVFIAHVFHNSIHPNSPLYPGKPTNQIMAYAAPVDGEPMVSKSVNGAFIGTKLEKLLRDQEVRQLIVCGITTAHCVSTTVRLASDLGVVKRDGDDMGVVAIVGDASAAFNNAKFDAETVHAVNLASLQGEFAEVVDVTDVVGTVLRTP